MGNQAVVGDYEKRERLTERRITVTRRQVHRIERSKNLVCGVPSQEALNDLRRSFEALLPLLAEKVRDLNSGALDSMSDDELRQQVTTLQERDIKMANILDGSQRIGLPAVEPFPRFLAEFQAFKDQFQSQIEGILLALSDSFQDLVKKSAKEISVPV